MWRTISTVFIALLALVWFLLFRPVALGGPASYITVTGTSMEPTLHADDFVIAKRRAAYQPGDIVAFRMEGRNVIHRIVATTPDGYVTQGDNQAEADPWEIDRGEVLGRLWLRLPRVGRVMERLQKPMLLAIAAAAITFLIMLASSGEASAPAGPGLLDRLWLFAIGYFSGAKHDFRALWRKARRPVEENLEYIEYRSFRLSRDEEREAPPVPDSPRDEVRRFIRFHVAGFVRDLRVLWRRITRG